MTNVLIVVDPARGFCDIGNLRNPLMERMVPNLEKLLEKKQAEGWEILFLMDNHQPGDKEFNQFPEHCLAGTEEAEIIPALRRFLKSDRSNYIPKTRHGGFFRTRLEEILERLAPEIVMVVGVCTDICVKYTVEELRNRDYRVQVVADCVTTYHIEVEHDADEVNAYELRHMRNVLGAEIIPTAAAA